MVNLVPKDRFCGDLFNLSSRGYGHALAYWSKTVKELNRLECIIYGTCKPNNEMNAHHLLYKNDYHLLSLNIKNGTTLCIPCHKELHYGRKSDL